MVQAQRQNFSCSELASVRAQRGKALGAGAEVKADCNSKVRAARVRRQSRLQARLCIATCELAGVRAQRGKALGAGAEVKADYDSKAQGLVSVKARQTTSKVVQSGLVRDESGLACDKSVCALESVDHLLVGCIVSRFLFISLLDAPHALTSMEDVNTIWEALARKGAQGFSFLVIFFC
uniref:Uncharacterized protein n=1 Tax=Ananas comosus var. bracteatus TaxID=296719 RepID=A0A6V7PEB4_ANACO|nr:unnamed protein product [Ananas comosus var. bracteatus]